MPLIPRTRLGVYEVVGLLGAGGMGEVYRARDTKPRREVTASSESAGVTALVLELVDGRRWRNASKG